MATHEFVKLVSDFTADLFRVFPEYEEYAKNDKLHNGYIECMQYQSLGDASANFHEDIEALYTEISTNFPKQFFNILYRNEEVFAEELTLLPSVDLHYIWHQEISDQTRDVIWNYLYLFLFTTLENCKDATSFGDTADLFKAIDADTLKQKLKETVQKMQENFTDSSGVDISSGDFKAEDMPNAEEIHSQVESMMQGKIGKLAQEIAEETAQELDIDFEQVTDMNDIFKKLFQNPQKLMSMMKNVGGKLDKKMKDGEFKESELMEEAQKMMEQMKGMPGMKDLTKMMGKNGFPDLGKMGGTNLNAMQSHLRDNIRKSKQKERMTSKLRERRETNFKNMSDVKNEKFTVGEGAAAHRTTRGFDETAKQALKPKKSNKAKKARKKKK